MVLAAATLAYRFIMRIYVHRQARHEGRSAAAAVTVAIAAVIAGGLAGCSAQTSPFRGLAKAANFATDTPPPADFVGETRRQDARYMRITRELPGRPTEARKADDVKALEQSMENVRAGNAAAGAATQAEGRTPPPAPAKAPPAAESTPPAAESAPPAE